jgi:sensor histidine kinase YesM
MKKWLEAIVHILFWGCSTWLIASGFSIQSHEIEVINGIEVVKIVRNNGLIYQLLICIFFSMIAFYINPWLIININQTESRKNSITFIFLTFIVLMILIYTVTEVRLFISTPPIPKQIAFGVAVFYLSISVAYGLVKNSIYSEQRHQQLIIDKKQAELNLLRNQLQPHFLFNVLNNFLSMVNRSDNPKLVSSFDKLSQLLRFVIEDNKAEVIAISKEIQFLKNYIDLQMLRFEEGEVSVQFNVKGEYDTQKIEPGLFIPFVENAFKYGTEPEKFTNISIEFDLSKPESVQFEIKNKKMINRINSIGTGIETTKKRLHLIYSDKHKLEISNGNEFIVKLTISTQ